MAQELNPQHTPSLPSELAEQRLLHFVNKVDAAEELENQPQSRSIGSDKRFRKSRYALSGISGKEVLDQRQQLDQNRFEQVADFRKASRLREDAWQELVNQFTRPAADIFRQEMYEEVLGSNWDLNYRSIQFSDRASFDQMLANPASLLSTVKTLINGLSSDKKGNADISRLAERILEQSYVEVHKDSHMASYAWAMWFYRFDQDNWFGFEQVREVIEEYFETYMRQSEPIHLYLYKDFPNAQVLADPITVSDLPVMINHAEQRVTVWVCTLRD